MFIFWFYFFVSAFIYYKMRMQLVFERLSLIIILIYNLCFRLGVGLTHVDVIIILMFFKICSRFVQIDKFLFQCFFIGKFLIVTGLFLICLGVVFWLFFQRCSIFVGFSFVGFCFSVISSNRFFICTEGACVSIINTSVVRIIIIIIFIITTGRCGV